MIRLVLFDIDGTLIYTSAAGEKAFARVFATQFGINHGTERLKFAGRTDPSVLEEFFRHNKIPETTENYDRFFHAYVFTLDHFLQQLPGGIHPGVERTIQDLRQLPEPPMLGLLTGNIRLGAEIKLRRFGLWDHFEMGAFADQQTERNEIARAARRQAELLLGPIQGSEILVIGDTPLDIACARVIDAKVLAVATGTSKIAELKQHQPDWAVENLNQISAEELCAW